MEKIFYACKAAVHDGVDRCRNEQGKCPHHDESSPAAPRPDMILFRFMLDHGWRSEFSSVELDFRTWSDRQQMEAEHVQEAQVLGRKAYITPLMNKKADIPEAAHSGNPISGRDSGGWKSVDVQGLIAEFRAAGFALNNVSVLATSDRNKKPWLVLAFAKGVPEYTDFPWRKLDRLIARPFSFVHVWTNARKDGVVKHTVNCIGPMYMYPGKPTQSVLHYDGGDWALKPATVAKSETTASEAPEHSASSTVLGDALTEALVDTN